MHDSQFQGFLFLGFIFFRAFFPGILFPETLLAAPILFQEKKSQESKTPDFISSDIFSKDLIKFRLFSKVFISGFFFQKLFFPGLSYIDSLSSPYRIVSAEIENMNLALYQQFQWTLCPLEPWGVQPGLSENNETWKDTSRVNCYRVGVY